MEKDSIFAALKTTEVNGFLAQLVEQRIENPCVPGSIPGETTNHLQHVGGFFMLIYLRAEYKKFGKPTIEIVFKLNSSEGNKLDQEQNLGD